MVSSTQYPSFQIRNQTQVGVVGSFDVLWMIAGVGISLTLILFSPLFPEAPIAISSFGSLLLRCCVVAVVAVVAVAVDVVDLS
jgi:hypothetical protein